MSVIKFLRDITGLFNWSTDENPTSQQDYQNAVKNWVATETSIVDALLWQPKTVYAVGNQVKTPSLPSESVLVCTVAGTSGASEPDYTNVSVGDTVTDGTVEWKVSAVFTSNGGTMTGTLTLADGGKALSNAVVGTVVSKTASNISLTANTSKTLTSISLPAGTWIITGHCDYGGVTSGNSYGLGIDTSQAFAYARYGSASVQSSSAKGIAVSTVRIMELTSTTTVYLLGYTTTSSTVGDAYLYAVRIV